MQCSGQWSASEWWIVGKSVLPQTSNEQRLNNYLYCQKRVYTQYHWFDDDALETSIKSHALRRSKTKKHLHIINTNKLQKKKKKMGLFKCTKKVLCQSISCLDFRSQLEPSNPTKTTTTKSGDYLWMQLEFTSKRTSCSWNIKWLIFYFLFFSFFLT